MIKKSSFYFFLFLFVVACMKGFDPHPFISRIVRDPDYLYVADTNGAIDIRNYQRNILSQNDYATELLSCLKHYKEHFKVMKEVEVTGNHQKPFYSVIISDKQDSNKLEFGFRRTSGNWELVNILFKGKSCIIE